MDIATPDIDKTVLWDTAEAHMDPTYRRGDVSRGAYIVSTANPCYYLNRHGEWTLGMRDEDNWWNTIDDAMRFLLDAATKRGK